MDKQEQMFALVEQYYQSGLSARLFSEQHHISYTTFSYWVRRKRELSRRENSDGEFIPVNISGNISSPTDAIELTYPNGVQVKLPVFNREQISQLLSLV